MMEPGWFPTCGVFQVTELQRASRKRRQLATGEVLQLPVSGRGNSSPVAGPAGVQETWAWLNKELDQLKVTWSSLLGICCSIYCATLLLWTSLKCSFKQ